MALYQIENLSFSYPGERKNVLKNIDLSIGKGDFVVLCGPSGSGKTTLLKHLKKSLTPVGKRTGKVLFKGQNILEMDRLTSVSKIGMVFQNPDDQIVMDVVLSELVFSMENLGIEPDAMRIRLAEVVHYFGIEELLHKKTCQLSGGEKQLINLCSVLVLQPEVLIFDEPTAQLDPIARKAFINMVYQLNFELGITVVMSEHILDDVLYYAHKIVYLEAGSVLYDLPNREFCQALIKDQKNAQTFLPSIPRLPKLIGRMKPAILPITISEGRNYLRLAYLAKKTIKFEHHYYNESPVLYQLKNLYYGYNLKQEFVLEDIHLKIYAGEFVAILGANGSGKTTLLKCLTGMLQPQKGSIHYEDKAISYKNLVKIREKVGYVDQNTLVHFAYESVEMELDFGFTGAEYHWKKELIELFGFQELMSHHPYDLSGGEQEKLAIILALAKGPKLLLLDEPTKGLDPISKNHLSGILRRIAEAGTAIVCVTHDVDFAANNAQRAVLLFNKAIVFDGSPRKLFTENHYFTTNINLIMKQINPACMIEEDIIQWERLLEDTELQ